MSDPAEDAVRFYQETILRHSRAPRHARPPTRIDAIGIGDNPFCGDHVEIFLAHDSSGAIADIGFQAHGCAISIASADLMADLLHGAAPHTARTLEAAFRHMIETGDESDPALQTLRPLGGVADYPSRRRCATLPWQALLQALDSPQQAQGAV